MKLRSRLQLLKQQRDTRQAGATAGGSLRLAPSTWVLLGLLLLLGGVATLAVFEVFIWNRIPPELAGFWEVDEGPQKGGTFEFFRGGTVEVHLKNKKRDITHKANVAVRGKTLRMTTKNLPTMEETTNDATIHALTADTLILELEQGDVLKMVRVE